MSDGTDLVTVAAEGEPAGELDTVDVQHPVSHEGTAHPGPRQYVIIAVVLVILTGVEVATSYLDGDVSSNLLIAALGIMAAIKFFLVAAWYMHMKQDAPFFRRLFVVGMALAATVYGVVLFAFSSTVLKS
jgi:cytochrome c oxidase subunit 4